MKTFWVDPGSPDVIAELCRLYKLPPAAVAEIRREVRKARSDDCTYAIAACARKAYQLENERREREVANAQTAR